MLILLWLTIFVGCGLTVSSGETETHDHHPLLVPGKCKGLWRPDTLPGKCFGVNPTAEFEDLKAIKIVNVNECRALCCNLNERCTTWQFQNSTGTCFIQKEPVRKGPEGADTALYCDPFPPNAWNGNRLISRKESVCEWGEPLPNQCFAFGREKIGPYKEREDATTEGRLDTDQCRAACCANKDCDSWQEMPGRGCYFGKSDCHKGAIDGEYDGQRKCLLEFCGGLEDQILKKYMKHNPDVKLWQKPKKDA